MQCKSEALMPKCHWNFGIFLWIKLSDKYTLKWMLGPWNLVSKELNTELYKLYILYKEICSSFSTWSHCKIWSGNWVSSRFTLNENDSIFDMFFQCFVPNIYFNELLWTVQMSKWLSFAEVFCGLKTLILHRIMVFQLFTRYRKLTTFCCSYTLRYNCLCIFFWSWSLGRCSLYFGWVLDTAAMLYIDVYLCLSIY